MTRQKCLYMTGGHSSEGQVGGAKRNTPCTTTFITTSDNVMQIGIIMYAIVIDPKINA